MQHLSTQIKITVAALLTGVVSLFLSVVFTGTALASPYGSGGYSNDTYGGSGNAQNYQGSASQPNQQSSNPVVRTLTGAVTAITNAAQSVANSVSNAANQVVQKVRQAIRATTPAVANSIPYLLLIPTLLLILVLIVQAAREVDRTLRARKLMVQESLIVEDKNNFLRLAAHYLRTPYSYIQLSSRSLPDAVVKAARQVGADIEFLIGHIEAAVTTISPEPVAKTLRPRSTLITLSFLLPVAGTLALTIIANRLFTTVARIHIPIANIIGELTAIVVVALVLYSIVRNHKLKVLERRAVESVVSQQRRLSATKSDFIERGAQVLRKDLADLRTEFQAVSSATSPIPGPVALGMKELGSLVAKFDLLGSVGRGSPGPTDPFDFREVVASVVERYKKQLRSSQINVEVKGESATLSLDPPIDHR